jgi:hypothetical protein
MNLPALPGANSRRRMLRRDSPVRPPGLFVFELYDSRRRISVATLNSKNAAENLTLAAFCFQVNIIRQNDLEVIAWCA